MVIFLAGVSLLFGQIDSDAVTIQASRPMYLPPDQVVFSVSVSAGPNTSLGQVVAALSNSGITAANLSTVAGGTDNQSPLYWDFTLAAPLTKMKATIASLTALQQSIVQNNSGMMLMFQVQGSQVSSDLIQSQACSMKDLVSDARAQAQGVVAAAGLAIGPIIALSNLTSGAVSNQVLSPPTFASRIGTSLLQILLTVPRSSPFNCSLEVKFKLLRY